MDVVDVGVQALQVPGLGRGDRVSVRGKVEALVESTIEELELEEGDGEFQHGRGEFGLLWPPLLYL